MSNKDLFPVGAKVRFRVEVLDYYKVEFSRRVKNGRIGVVRGHTYPRGLPLVTFPADGRRAEYLCPAGVDPKHLEIVEPPSVAPINGECK